MGSLQIKTGHYQIGIEYLKKYLSLVQSTNQEDTQKLAGQALISKAYQAIGKYREAYGMYMKTLKIREALQDTIGIIQNHYDIGVNFFHQKNYAQARKWYLQALDLAKDLNQSRIIYDCLAGMTALERDRGNHEEAIKWGIKALIIVDSLDYKEGRAYVFQNLGSCYVAIGEIDKGLAKIEESIILKRELNNFWGLTESLITAAEVYQSQGRIQDAEDALQEALEITQIMGSNTRQAEVKEKIAHFYFNTNRPKEAFLLLEEYVLMRDTMYSNNLLVEIGKRQNQYKLNQQESQIKSLIGEQKLAAQEDQIHTLTLRIYGLMGLFLLIAAITFFHKYNTHSQLNKELQVKNEVLALQQKQLEAQAAILEEKNQEIEAANKGLIESNQQLQSFTSVASHDLKEPLRMISSYTQLLRRKYSHAFDERGLEFMNFIVDGTDRMYQLLEDLLNYSKVNKGNLQKEPVVLGDVFHLTLQNLRTQIQSNQALIHLPNQTLPTINGIQTQLIQLFQNLLSNAIKFKRSDVHPIIHIQVTQNNNEYLIQIKDNGVGIRPEDHERVFEMFTRLHTRSEYDGTGIGLATCKKIVESHQGRIWLESSFSHGSTFYITFPVPEDVSNQTIKESTSSSLAS